VLLSPSVSGEVRRSLGEEGARPLEHVLAREDAIRRIELGGEAGVDVEVLGVLDQALGLAHRDRAALGDRLAHGGRGGAGLAALDDPVDEPDLGGAKGTQLPNSPEWAGALGLNYDFMLGALPAYVGGTWNYTGKIPYGFSGFTDRNGVYHSTSNPRYLADDYSILDLQAGILTERYQASLYVKNVLNEYAYSTFTPNATASSLAVPVVPRTVGVTLRVNFE